VWDVAEKELRLKSHLFGHAEPITCIACSPSYNIIVSGSKDSTCIVWDLARLSFVRQLVNHTAPIDAVGVNELTGEIATCDSSWIHLWTVNGELIGEVDTAGVSGGGGMSQGILCVGFSILNEWDCDNVLMTGSMDGIVRMWSVRYFQVPLSEAGKVGRFALANKSISEDSSLVTASDTDPDDKDEEEVEEKDMDRLGVETLDPDKDRDSLEDVHEAVETSDTNNGSLPKKEEYDSSSETPTGSPRLQTHADKVQGVIRRQRALSSGTDKQSSSDKCEVAEAKKVKRRSDIPSKDGEKFLSQKISIRGSKSETSLSFDADESFEVVSETDMVHLRNEERKLSHGAAILEAHKLKEGHVWQRRLAFRGKLTMHTAYDRKDNTEPASITAISVSKWDSFQ
jgi:WD40 repeat protein